MSKETNKEQVSIKESCVQLAIDSYPDFKDLVGLLTKNGFRLETEVVFKTFPNTGTDYYVVRILT